MSDFVDVPAARPVRALVVGGAPAEAQRIARLLKEVGGVPFEVLHTQRMSDALDRHEREPFDVLLWDAAGWGSDPWDTPEALKRAAARAPLVALADSDDAAAALEALRVGAQDYLVRAETDAAALTRALRHAIERHRLVQELQRAGAQARFLASHDGLTGLSNRGAFQVLLGRALSLAERKESRLAVLFLDLDGFKHINDTLGHSVGDELIRQVAARLNERVRKSDVLARLGGDEFVVMLQDTRDDRAPGKVAETLLEILAEPYQLGGRDYWITASIGIAEFPGDGSDEDSLIRYADAAMYKAKSLGRNNYQFYSQALGSAAVRRLDLERKLRRAVDDDLLEVHYQPVIDLEQRRVVGAEALLRWMDPVLGAVPPADIVALAEETGLVQPIGKWVLETACRDAAVWQRAGAGIRVMVNVSAHQLVHSDLRETIVGMLWETGLRPENLDIELTETAFMRNEASAIEVLEDLKRIGVDISLDDFGTGFSSLSYLKRMPVDTVKIDRSFVHEIAVDSDDAAITVAILSIAATLDLKVVAEGVETIAQMNLLARNGCKLMQGFVFSPAVPADAFGKLLQPGVFGDVFRACRGRGAGQPS